MAGLFNGRVHVRILPADPGEQATAYHFSVELSLVSELDVIYASHDILSSYTRVQQYLVDPPFLLVLLTKAKDRSLC